MTLPTFDELPDGSSWGVWGADDVFGTLNLLKGKVADPAAGRIAIDGQEVAASKRITHLQAGEACKIVLYPGGAPVPVEAELSEPRVAVPVGAGPEEAEADEQLPTPPKWTHR